MPRRFDAADLAVVLVAVAAFALLLPAYWPYVNDDAFISFRYAANLLAGDGLTFNPGERVEGYTNFLWVLVSALLLAAGGPEKLLVLTQALGALLTAGTIVATYLAARCSCDHRWVAAFPALLLALNPGLAVNAVSGLETALFTLLLTLALLSRLRGELSNGLQFGVVMALATLTRPEGAYLFAVLMLIHLLKRVPLKRIVRTAAAYGALVGPYLVWKWLYYGALLPNTFHAKPATLAEGLEYAGWFVSAAGYTRLLALPLVTLLAGGLLSLRPLRWPLVFAATLASAVVISGGDWMLGWRFWVPALPALFLLLAVAVDRLLGALLPRRRAAAVAATLALCLLIGWALATPRQQLAAQALERGQGQRDAHLHIARWLADNASAGESVALMDIGMIGFHGGLRTIDISGLTDPQIARAPGRMIAKEYDPAYIFDKRPSYLVLVGSRPAAGSADEGWYFDPDSLWFQDRQLALHAEFGAHYEYLFSRAAPFEGYLHLFRRVER